MSYSYAHYRIHNSRCINKISVANAKRAILSAALTFHCNSILAHLLFDLIIIRFDLWVLFCSFGVGMCILAYNMHGSSVRILLYRAATPINLPPVHLYYALLHCIIFFLTVQHVFVVRVVSYRCRILLP